MDFADFEARYGPRGGGADDQHILRNESIAVAHVVAHSPSHHANRKSAAREAWQRWMADRVAALQRGGLVLHSQQSSAAGHSSAKRVTLHRNLRAAICARGGWKNAHRTISVHEGVAG